MNTFPEISDSPSDQELTEFCQGCDYLEQSGCSKFGTQSDADAKDNREHGLRRLEVLSSIVFSDDVDKVSEDFIEAAVDDSIARINQLTNQQRYVMRGCCGWAEVDGVGGDMTKDGFRKH